MAADDSKSVEFESQELYEKTTCCICTNVYTDPKTMPCMHTFCMKCIQETGLKTNKGPGDDMPCPMCRRQFKIPPEGFCGLPTNFFIAKLIQVANVSNLQVSYAALCDACLEENEETGKRIDLPKAYIYCTECKQKLCEECSRHHRKLKLTKNHTLMQINEHHLADDSAMLNVASSVCELHEQKVLDIYCVECKTVECAVCFIDGHKHHEGNHVSKFVEGFRKQIEDNVETMRKCTFRTENHKEELTRFKETMQQRVQSLEIDIISRRDEVKQLVDSQTNSILQSLTSVRQSKLKEIQMEADDIDAHLSCLHSYSSQCQNIMAKGSASDICRAVLDLSVKAAELQEQCEVIIERQIQSRRHSFTESEFEAFLHDCKFIGVLEGASNDKEFVKKQNESLREALKLTLAENRRLKSAKMTKLLEDLPMLKLSHPKEMDDENQQLYRKLRSDCDTLLKELQPLIASPNLVDVTNENTGVPSRTKANPFAQLMDRTSRLTYLKYQFDELQGKVTKFLTANTPGAQVRSDFGCFPTPAFARLLHEQSQNKRCVGVISIPCKPGRGCEIPLEVDHKQLTKIHQYFSKCGF